MVSATLVSVIAVIITFSKICHSQTNNAVCSNYLKCGICIQNPECVWCNKPGNSIHCQRRGEVSCSESVLDPEPSTTTITNDTTIGSRPRQIMPQNIAVKLRKNRPHRIRFQFVRASNDLDAYFLLDNSKTMEKHRQVLSTLSEQIAKEMRSLTNSFRLGFGSFVDKNLHPFGHHGNRMLRSHGPAYSFQNHLMLTNNTNEFTRSVRSVKISGNIDSPEGGLEALVQALTCTDEIGWRNHSTHMIIFSTDGPYHIAGDGRLVGVSAPNDGRCHTRGGKYENSEMIDYPSVSHLAHLIQTRNKFLLFAIVCDESEKYCNDYRNLVENLPNSHFTVLTRNSRSFADVISVIKHTYDHILTTVQFTHNKPADVDVQFRIRCNKSSDFIYGYSCQDLKIGDTVDIEVILNAKSCVDTAGYNRFNPFNGPLKINPVGIDEFLNINIKVFCDCDCEKHPLENTESCSRNGDEACGLCSCREGFSGKSCECNSTASFKIGDTDCIDPETHSVCSNHGACSCGECQCENKFYGRYCNCNDDSCPYVHGSICGGTNRGRCECGRCNCLEGFTGEDCSCAVSTATCQLSPDGDHCSGQGQCVCGECECNRGFYGRFCEECIDCDRCPNFEQCVAEFQNSKSIPEYCMEILRVSAISEVPRNSPNESDPAWKKCVLISESGCSTEFRYKVDKSKAVTIEVEPESCSFIKSPTGILVSLISAIVIGGLIALCIWKFCVVVLDRREFTRFQNDRINEKWHAGQNPLFKPPVNTFENPTYTAT